jgi:Fic family protein
MMTLRKFSLKPETIPVSTSWYLTDLAEARGKQELFTRQSPQKLKALREHALIESAVSSNRIEGVDVDQKRIATVIFGKSLLRDRDEEEVRGYRNALKLIHEQGAKLAVSEDTVKKLHYLSRAGVGDAGKYKVKASDIIERYADGRERIRFKTVSPSETPKSMAQLLVLWEQAITERWVHPLIALAAFNLDFLCIHPFRDGNGRVSRLLILLQCYHLGFEVGRYISLERIIEQNKERYYETLEQSSQRWHEGKHDPWPFVNYLLFILKTAYREFEQRADETNAPRGAKSEWVAGAIHRAGNAFRISDLQRECPGVSVDLIRQLLKKFRASGQVRCLGRGQNAQWEKTKKWQMGNNLMN